MKKVVLTGGITDIHVPNDMAMTVVFSLENSRAHENTIHIEVSKNASLQCYFLQNSANTERSDNHFLITQWAASRCVFHDYQLGLSEIRNQFDVALNGVDAKCDILGVVVASESQRCQTQTTMLHNAPRTRSTQNYRGIAQDKANAQFISRVIVQKDAQHILSEQQNKNLLLSDQAKITTRPELEIYADDVKCAHGATVGQLDEDALFYLQSRGIAAKEARSLLTYAFVANMVDTIENADFRSRVIAAMQQAIPNANAMELPL
ncbi:MAG: SufD family Fe-S cluster assembly protein [Coxiellaceae bacterium]|nr:SufD family Fe-S cluster assembly protein [Coxiellaceae bacterium]